MKKNKGFFLAETIIVLALVTAIVAFVYPNVSKLYENYINITKYYDQVQDLYTLKVISEQKKVVYEEKNILGTIINTEDIRSSFSEIIENIDITDDLVDISDKFDEQVRKLIPYDKLYITSYLSTPSVPDDYPYDEYEFGKYLKRLKKTSYDPTSYRLIGVFKEGTGENQIIRYASIKIQSDKIVDCP